MLSAAQVEDLTALYRWRANLDHWENVYRHRPKKSPMEAPREWWHYALAGTRVTKQRRSKPAWAKVITSRVLRFLSSKLTVHS